ncbi:MAG: hypothetical protein JSW00_10295 [Thermoplasmata archaeon]|nr:MAG: hypothetical protein JSW00_10295 [Thermoplasmata archaeon]
MSKKDKSKFDDEDIICKYRLEYDSNKVTMVADCKECNGGGELNDGTCLRGILKGFCQEFNVDNVILSHYIETKYTDESIQMLRMMVEIINDLDQMSIRRPYDEYFKQNPALSSTLKNKQKDTCEKCDLGPGKVFILLKEQYVKDIHGFYEEYNNLLGKIEENEDEECLRCISATKSDLVYLFNKLENLRAYVIYKGFQIII